jgi:GNAT superfamily N-acetyltransferase
MGALAAPPAGPGDDGRVAAIVAAFRAREVSDFTFWLAPGTPPEAWTSILWAHGFRPTEGPPGMTVDLTTLREAALPGLRIVPVTDAALLRKWTMTFIAGYEVPPDWEPPLFDLLSGIGLDLPVRHYLGYLDDKPVATSSLFLSAGVAGIQFVSTVREARGRGLGAALTLAPLLEARRMGYRIGVLQSSELGFPVYRRMGFQQVCQVEHFYWKRNGAHE